jgi:8-oxo-dGTP diphosphatase
METVRRYSLVIICNGAFVLLGKKHDDAEVGAGTINAPGGKQEPGETALECAVREVPDETGIRIEPTSTLHIATLTAVGPTKTRIVEVFWTNSFKGELQATAEMVPGWYEASKLPFDQMLGADPYWFERAVRGERFCARITYGTDTARDFRGIEFFPYTPPMCD